MNKIKEKMDLQPIGRRQGISADHILTPERGVCEGCDTMFDMGFDGFFARCQVIVAHELRALVNRKKLN
jgi:hypothetical protein